MLASDRENIHMLEPAWKLLLGNKAILAVLWEMFPGHPNLLPSFFDVPLLEGYEQFNKQKFVSKPRFAREGVGIKFSEEETLREFIRKCQDQSSVLDGQLIGKPIFQKYCALPHI